MPPQPSKPSSPQSASKACARCRKPIDGTTQDAFHSMYCWECSQALKAAVQRLRRPDQPAQPAPVHDTPRAAVTPKPEPPPIPLADQVLLTPEDHGPSAMRSVPQARPDTDDLSVSAPDPTVKYETRICLNCSQTVDLHKPICAFCRYDARKGLPKKLRVEAPDIPKCRECGYELTGLTKPTCPECGTTVSLTRRGNSYGRDSQEVRKWAYLKPAIMIGVGLAGMLLIDIIRHPGEAMYLVYRLVSTVTAVVAVFITYVLCCVAWIGFDMPLHLVALRIAGCYAAALLFYTLLAFLPIPIIPLGFASVAYVWMLHTELDLELQDALIVSVLSLLSALMITLIAVKIAVGMGMTI